MHEFLLWIQMSYQLCHHLHSDDFPQPDCCFVVGRWWGRFFGDDPCRLFSSGEGVQWPLHACVFHRRWSPSAWKELVVLIMDSVHQLVDRNSVAQRRSYRYLLTGFSGHDASSAQPGRRNSSSCGCSGSKTIHKFLWWWISMNPELSTCSLSFKILLEIHRCGNIPTPICTSSLAGDLVECCLLARLKWEATVDRDNTTVLVLVPVAWSKTIKRIVKK